MEAMVDDMEDNLNGLESELRTMQNDALKLIKDTIEIAVSSLGKTCRRSWGGLKLTRDSRHASF
jgi:hypothetical protein